MFVFAIPLSFFIPLIVHLLAASTAGITGIVAFSVSKRRGRHFQWGIWYVWAYTVVFLTATILSVQHWKTDAYLFVLASGGYGLACGAYAARRWRRELWMLRIVGKQWVVVHVVGMIGSYAILWTAFFVDNANQIPLLDQIPQLTFWLLPIIIALPFLFYSLSRFARKYQPARPFTMKGPGNNV
jgi:hypothetical protein